MHGEAGPGNVSDRQRGLLIALGGVLLYVLLHAGFRMLASSTLGEDDTLDQILVQELRAGYNPRQPPLYDWVLYAVQQVTGPRLIGFLAIKYAALTATVVFIYLSAYRILKDRLWALLTVESLALIYQISWRYHEGFTHEVLAMVAVSATLWAFLRLYDCGRTGDYVVFGVIAGLGMLTEPNYSVYQICLWIAVSLQPSVRCVVVGPRLLISAVIALGIASPFILWVVGDSAHFDHYFRASTHGHFKDMLIGVKDAVRGPFMYLAPLIVILPAVFPGFVRTGWDDIRGVKETAFAEGSPDLERLVLTTMLTGIALSIFGGLVFGIGGYAMHVLMPLYVTSVIWLFAVAQRVESGLRRRPVLARLALAIAVIALVARLANMFIHDPVCGKCRWGIPYPELAQTLRVYGYSGGGTILVPDDELGGNLRQHFPAARVGVVGREGITPDFSNPLQPKQRSGPLLLIWDADVPERLWLGTYGRALGLDGAAFKDSGLIRIPWTHLWKAKGYRTSDWRYILLPSQDGQPGRRN
ncbi:MAG: glycosyltransferase family 39 protein [Hyphomicrobiaceae bacterium]|nr:glycosyltransferase family 39 protein [Hyphomicrobiaceae bacterium]